MDLVQIKDPMAKYEAMTKAGPVRSEVIPQVEQPTPIHSTKG